MWRNADIYGRDTKDHLVDDKYGYGNSMRGDEITSTDAAVHLSCISKGQFYWSDKVTGKVEKLLDEA